MKQTTLATFLSAAILMAGCGDNKEAATVKEETKPASSQNKESSSTSTAQHGNLVGEWEMVSSVVDTNDNLQIDDEERSKLQPVPYKDYMKLNADGTGLFTIAKMEGRYEIKKDQNNGREVMAWYDKGNGRHRVGSIMKVTKDELTIKEPGGSGLFLWKRL